MSRFDYQNDLNVIGLLHEGWAAKWFLLSGIFVGLIVAFCFSVVAVSKFEARMMVGPAQPLEVSMQARFQDGQNSYVLPSERALPSEHVSHFVRFEAMMRGVSVSRLLLRDKRIVEGLENDRMFVFEGGKTDLEPADLADYIAKRVKLDRFGETALKEIVYRHQDTAFAAYFVQQIHRVADQLIRAELRAQVDERIAYLERVLVKMPNPEQRRIVANLLLEQERARMTVSMDAPVAASVIEPAAVGTHKVWPDGALVYGGLGIFGLLIGYLAFGFVSYKEQETLMERERMRRRQQPHLRDRGLGGEDLQHKPRRPLKYGSWFQNSPDNDVVKDDDQRRKRDASDAAE